MYGSFFHCDITLKKLESNFSITHIVVNCEITKFHLAKTRSDYILYKSEYPSLDISHPRIFEPFKRKNVCP